MRSTETVDGFLSSAVGAKGSGLPWGPAEAQGTTGATRLMVLRAAERAWAVGPLRSLEECTEGMVAAAGQVCVWHTRVRPLLCLSTSLDPGGERKPCLSANPAKRLDVSAARKAGRDCTANTQIVTFRINQTQQHRDQGLVCRPQEDPSSTEPAMQACRAISAGTSGKTMCGAWVV